ncbi:MAG: phosphate signaling complex protein PhoU [Solirubrobacteraceae bacterium]
MKESRHNFHEELRWLESQMLDGMDLVAGQLERALECVSEQDVELSATVVADDGLIDARYLEVHNGVLSLLARETPVAGDLRLVAALLHSIRCIERMGDQCANIAKLVPLSRTHVRNDRDTLEAINRMGQLAHAQVLQSKVAFKTRHIALAHDLARHQAQVNRINREIFNRVVQAGEDRGIREWAMFMVLVARALGRISDNAVDIGEQSVFVVTGHLGSLSPDTPPPAFAAP